MFADHALLRVPCSPSTQVGEMFHKHECPKCKHQWAHLDLLPHLGLAHEDFNVAHTCEKCGTEQFDKLMDQNELTKWPSWMFAEPQPRI